MLSAIAVAATIVVGAPLPLLGMMLLAAHRPYLGALLAAAAVVAGIGRDRVPVAVSEGTYLQAVASELRTGASLRAALALAVTRVPELGLARIARLTAAGAPIVEIQEDLRSALPRTGAATAAALEVLDETGGRAGPVFEGLAVVAFDDAALARETRATTAAARLSGVIVGGLPVCFVAFMVVSGQVGSLLAAAPFVVLAGGLLLGAGVGSMAMMLRRAARTLDPDREAVATLATLVLVSLSAGLSLRGALERAVPALSPLLQGEVGAVLREVAHHGLTPSLARAPGAAAPFFRVLARASVTGASLATAVGDYLVQARETQKTAALERARKLPVQLMVPLALLVLPAFVLLTVGPALIASLDRVLTPYLP